MPAGRCRRARGFTLVEVLVVVAIVAILASVAVWGLERAFAAERSRGAAARLVSDVRRAAAIAARTNHAVHLRSLPVAADCGPGWEIVEGPDPAAPIRSHDRVCIHADYPGVALDSTGATDAVRCPADGAMTALPNCSFCSPGARLTVFPTGEVAAVAADGAALEGHTAVFQPAHGSIEDRAHDTFAAGIQGGTGRARVYARDAVSPTTWSCR